MLALTPPPHALTYAEPQRQRRCASCGANLPLDVRFRLRSRSRPVFEGDWSCGKECLYSRVLAAIRRESRQSTGKRHRHRLPLGLLLLSNGSVSQASLQHARSLQHGTDDRIGDVLIRECGLSERQVAEALAVQWGCSVYDVESAALPSGAWLAPARLMERSGAVPMREPGSARLLVAFAHAVDAQAVFALQKIHRTRVDACVTTVSRWTAAQHAMQHADHMQVQATACMDDEDVARAAVRVVQRLQPVESRWARVHDYHWLRVWLEPAALQAAGSQPDVQDFLFHVAAPASR